MSIATYAQLQDAIRKWMLKASTDLVVTDDQIENYISLCETEMNRELKVRELEETAILSTVGDQDYVALPANFKRIIDIYHDSAPFDISAVGSKGELKRKWGTASGRPSDYVLHGSNVFFGRIPDSVYSITLDYYKIIPALSDSATTNDILTVYPDIYLYGALRHAYINVKDKASREIVEANYVAMIDRIKIADQESRMAVNLRAKTRNRLA
jgi:hypothetical protein